MIKYQKKLLKLFTLKDKKEIEEYPHFTKPFVYNKKFVCATNLYLLIMIDKKLLSDNIITEYSNIEDLNIREYQYKKLKKYVNLKPKINKIVKVERIRKLIEKTSNNKNNKYCLFMKEKFRYKDLEALVKSFDILNIEKLTLTNIIEVSCKKQRASVYFFRSNGITFVICAKAKNLEK